VGFLEDPQWYSRSPLQSSKRVAIKALLKILAGIVLAIVLLMAAVLAYAAYANSAAEEAARNLCARLQIGSEIDRAIARARDERARHRGPYTLEATGAEVHDFQFQGWVFNVGVCRAGVAGGKITSLAASLEGD
jgi:hypothetical protein